MLTVHDHPIFHLLEPYIHRFHINILTHKKSKGGVARKM